MALRTVRLDGDELLRKKSRPVKEINENILQLLDDMAETMAHKNGLGLAAVQVGVLRRVVIIDVSEKQEGTKLIELINPEIIEFKGAQEKSEGCLSIPGKSGIVQRPEYVKVMAFDRSGEQIIVEGTDIMARALCHEIDHLNGILFTDKVIRFDDDDEEEYEDDEQ